MANTPLNELKVTELRLDEVVVTPRRYLQGDNPLNDRHEVFLPHPRGRPLADAVGEVEGLVTPRQAGRGHTHGLEPAFPALAEEREPIAPVPLDYLELQADGNLTGCLLYTSDAADE